jgi:UDP-N-acetylmuramoyl-L-alanyl-D-glutamate--2,6-diaminopimelate ligase
MAARQWHNGGDAMTQRSPLTLQELGLARSSSDLASLLIHGVQQDSRAIQSGDLFIARDGVAHKGIDFIESAAQKGAVVAIVDADQYADADLTGFSIPVLKVEFFNRSVGVAVSRFYGDPTQQMTVIGITGTNGKTSCAHYLAQALTAVGQKVAIMGTVGNGFLESLSTATHTTPDLINLHAMMREFKDQGADAVVMEVSSHALDQGRVAGIEFDVAALTQLSRDHLDYHKTMAVYAGAKTRLFTECGATHNVLNADDALGQTVTAMLGRSAFSYSADGQPDASLKAESVKLSDDGISMTLAFEQESIDVTVPVLGQFNVSNLLLVAAVLYRLKLKGEAIAAAMSSLKAVPGRMELFAKASSPTLVVDYAHTPDALEKALQACRAHCQGQLWVVFGCGGDRDTGKRAEMANVAETFADRVVVTSDNPRTEAPDAIIKMILDGFKTTESITALEDRREAIQCAFNHAAEADLILIAGKGHEDYQEIHGVKHPFSDRDIAASLQGLPLNESSSKESAV